MRGPSPRFIFYCGSCGWETPRMRTRIGAQAEIRKHWATKPNCDRKPLKQGEINWSVQWPASALDEGDV